MVTINELEAQIESLKDQLKFLQKGMDIPPNLITNKNYRDLVDRAENAFESGKYLEAFLIQSCVFEGVVKEYALLKILPIISEDETLNKKFKNFEFARLTDDLFIAGKINQTLYKELNIYRKKRNNVIHELLRQNDAVKLDEELKIAYESGRSMKGFIVDDFNKEIQKYLAVSKLENQIDKLISTLEPLKEKVFAKQK